jgi:4-diphosphocytidyl-2-C-methyl-D-erythritol kinase
VTIKLESPAKINLFLYVTGKRKDGFHDLCSLMTKIDLCDEIKIDFKGLGIRVVCDHPKVPDGRANLAYRAAELFFDVYEKRIGKPPVKGISISIKKQIPPGGGLGGGSSNAAIVLMALNEYYSKFFSKEELMGLGLKLGADVPFFIFKGPALATGIGETLEKYPGLPYFYLVLCDPGVSASTADVFKNLDFGLTFRPKYNINPGLNILPRGQGGDGREKLHNDLEGSACKLYPEIASTKEEMELLLKRNVYMSGSGSSLFALFPGPEAARKSYEILVKKCAQGPQKIFLSSFRL